MKEAFAGGVARGWSVAERCIGALLLVSVPAVLFCTVYFWRYNFSPDFALIGLMARHVVHFGEHPIFIWTVGYYGILFETHWIALLFKWLGEAPVVLQLAPALIFPLLLVFVYHSVRKSDGRMAALIACVLSTVCCPMYYAMVLRTQPNYVETFIHGWMLFFFYQKLLEAAYLPDQPDWRRVQLLSAVIGFLIGWGFYTYPMIAYFVGCLGAHAGLLYLRRFGARIRAPRALVPIQVVAAIGIVLGAVTFLLSIRERHFFGRRARWDPFTLARDCTLILVVLGVVPVLLRAALESNRRALAKAFALGFFFCLLGYSPKIYYNRVLGFPSIARLGMSGDLDIFRARGGIMGWGFAQILNVPTAPAWAKPAIILIGAVFAVIALVIFAREARAFVSGEAPRERVMRLHPAAFLIVVAPIAFCASDMIIDEGSSRYIMAVTFFFAWAFGKSATWLAGRYGRGGIWLAALSMGAVYVNNVNAAYRTFSELPDRLTEEKIADYLEARGIDRAYCDYWVSYSMVFLTHEKILVIPLESDYAPFYDASVEKADRVALIDRDPGHHLVRDGAAEIRGQRYRVVDSHPIDDRVVYVLERQS